MRIEFIWDPLEDNIVRELDGGGVTLAEYTTEPDHFGSVISQSRAGQSYYFHHDGLGSTLAVTDESATVTHTRAYSAFGETTETSGNTVFPFEYVGRKGYYSDSATGDQFIRRRAYKSQSGRWLSCDPLFHVFNRASGFFPVFQASGYIYALDNPLVYVDPSGLVDEYSDEECLQVAGRKCCCCVTGKIKLENIKEVEICNLRNKDVPCFGHRFDITYKITLHALKTRTERGFCSLQWWEWDYDESSDTIISDWTDQLSAQPGLKMWNDWQNKPKANCPAKDSKDVSYKITDTPGVIKGGEDTPRTINRTLYIAIKLTGADRDDCPPCEPPNEAKLILRIHQEMKENRLVVRDPPEEIDKLPAKSDRKPRQPGNPAGW
jgi:RHS repeat-associated protein